MKRVPFVFYIIHLDVSQNNTYVNDHFVFEAACKIVQDTIKHSQAEQRKYGEKEKKPSKYIFAVEINFCFEKINDDLFHRGVLT